jgi:hypothetical protein
MPEECDFPSGSQSHRRVEPDDRAGAEAAGSPEDADPNLRRVWAIYHGGDLPSSAAIVKALEVTPRLGLALMPRTVLTADQLEQILKEVRPGDALLAPDISTMDIPAVIRQPGRSGAPGGVPRRRVRKGRAGAAGGGR